MSESYRQYLAAWKLTFGGTATEGVWYGQPVARMTEEQYLKTTELLKAAKADWEQAHQTCDGLGMRAASDRCVKCIYALLLC